MEQENQTYEEEQAVKGDINLVLGTELDMEEVMAKALSNAMAPDIDVEAKLNMMLGRDEDE